jgi:hypothetical protein
MHVDAACVLASIWRAAVVNTAPSALSLSLSLSPSPTRWRARCRTLSHQYSPPSPYPVNLSRGWLGLICQTLKPRSKGGRRERYTYSPRRLLAKVWNQSRESRGDSKIASCNIAWSLCVTIVSIIVLSVLALWSRRCGDTNSQPDQIQPATYLKYCHLSAASITLLIVNSCPLFPSEIGNETGPSHTTPISLVAMLPVSSLKTLDDSGTRLEI